MLQKLQNHAARIVTNSSYDSSASALIKTLNWPTVAVMIKVETAYIVYKSINDLAADYLSEIFTKNSACSRKNLRNTTTDLQVPQMKTCNGQRTFSYRGARVWNHLDLEVKQAFSFKAFKDAVKIIYFAVSFYLFIYLFIHLFILCIIVNRIGFLYDK